MITLKNINKSYWIGENRLHVLKDVNLTVKQGDFVTILGASGSGKSTLMNIIGCMDNFDSGSYELDGLSTVSYTHLDVYKRQVIHCSQLKS